MKNHTKIVVNKLIPDHFLKIKMKHITGSIVESFIQLVFIDCHVEGYLKILKISYKPLDFTSYKAFLKNKKRSGTSLPASFSA